MHHITDRLHRNKAASTQPVAPLKPTSAPLNAQGIPLSTAPTAAPISTLETSFASTTLGTTTPLQQQGLPLQQGLQQQGWNGQSGLQQGQGLQQQGWNGQSGLQQSLPLQQGLQQQPLQQGLQQQGWSGQSGLQQGIQQPLQQGLQQQTWSTQQTSLQKPLQQGLQQQSWSGQQLQQGIQQPTLLQKESLTATTLHTTTRAPIIETHVRAPIVEQTTRINKVVEIQPVIHREIDAPQVRVIEQHSYERAALAGPAVINRAPIIEETLKPQIIEEIQPVLHREVPAPFVERVEQHITENVTAPAVTTKQVLSEARTLNVQEATQRGFVTAAVQQPVNQAPILHSHTAAPVLESHMRNTIVEQTVRPEKITEVQPIVHREIDAPRVHVIEKHSFEHVRSAGPSVITKQPIVQERVQPKIIEQIQPVLHREVPAPFVERVEQHTQEKVVAPTTTTKQVLTERSVVQGVPLIPQQRAAPEAPIVRSTTAVAQTEHLERPAIIQQTARPEKITEVQPVIHREIDAPQVRVIEQHTYERERSMGPSLITKAAVVEEVVIPKIVEEIQPIIHREVPQTVIERQEQHTTERLVQPTTTTKQVVQDSVTRQLPAMERSIGIQETNLTPVVRSTTAATQMQSHTNPTMVQQTVRPEKITEVQPVIHRQIDATEVHVIEKHLYEKVPSAGPSMITKQAIIEETLHPKIIEEVQPVLHREVPAPFVERVEQHVTERITQPTVSTKEVIMDRTSHLAGTTNQAAWGTTTTTTALPATTQRTTTTTTTTQQLPLGAAPLAGAAIPVAPPLPAKHRRAHKRV